MLSAEGAITVKFIEYAMRAKEEDKLAMIMFDEAHAVVKDVDWTTNLSEM